MKRVIIYAQQGARIAGGCRGNGWVGGCPKVPAGRPVLCAGHRIRVVNEVGRVELDIAVPADATSCPLAMVDLGASAAR